MHIALVESIGKPRRLGVQVNFSGKHIAV
jgi:hypothetical protein